MLQEARPTNARRNLYSGYTAEVTSPSLTAYPLDAIQSALQFFDGMAVVVSEKPGLGRPRVKRILAPPGARFGKVIDASGEIAGFGEKALFGAVQNLLSRIKPTI
jgi:hypothetical protein